MTDSLLAQADALIAEGRITEVPARTYVATDGTDVYQITAFASGGAICTCVESARGVVCHHRRAALILDERARMAEQSRLLAGAAA